MTDSFTGSFTVPNDLCPRCAEGRVYLVRKNAEYTDEGDTVSYVDEFMHCDVCGESFRTTEQSMARSRTLTDALRKYRGLLTADEIEEARDQYGLSLSAFEKALGVGKNTVGRWERGVVPPTAAANLGLWVALNEPEVFAKWAQLRGVILPKLPEKFAIPTAALRTTASPSEENVVDLTTYRYEREMKVNQTKTNDVPLAAEVGGTS